MSEASAKPIYQSKTAWLQVITLIAAFFPQVQTFLIAHPQAAIAILGALNIAVRIVTRGEITIFADGTDAAANNSGTSPAWVAPLLTGVTAAGIGLSLPSCNVPIRAGISSDYGSASYSSKSGIDVQGRIPTPPAVDAASAK